MKSKKVCFGAVTLLWLISSTCGRFIDSHDSIDTEKSTDESSRNLETKRNPRLSEPEWSTYSVREPNGPGTFAFGYDNAVDPAGNEHYRSEERFENGTVIGEYGYVDNVIRRMVHVTYTADHRGYRAKTRILPLDGSARN